MEEKISQTDAILKNATTENHNRELSSIPADNELAKLYPNACPPEAFQATLSAFLENQ